MTGWELLPISTVAERVRSAAQIVGADEYELWSVPSFDRQKPDFVRGEEVGSAKQSVTPGDVLLCKINPRINRVWLVTESNELRQIASTEWIAYRSRSTARLLPEYLLWFFRSPTIRDRLCTDVTGATGSHTRAQAVHVDNYEIPVPPLSEQKRIVSILDAAFEGIAIATANAELNIANARELFAEGLRAVFSSSANDWETVRIGDVCTLKSGHTLPPELERPSGDIPYLKVADMTYPGNETEVTTSSRFLDKNSIKAGGVIPAGATIFPKRGGAILTNKKRITRVPTWLDLNIMAVIPTDRIDPEFLHMYFQSVDMRRLGSGSSIPQINNYDIEPLQISMPKSVKKQREVANRLMGLRDQSARLEELYALRVDGLVDLKKSLLHKAFSGQLTGKEAIAA